MASNDVWIALSSGGLAGIMLAAHNVWKSWRSGAEKKEDRAAEKVKNAQTSAIRRAETAERLYEASSRRLRWWINRATRLERVIVLRLGEEAVPPPTTPEPEEPLEPEMADG